MAERIDSFDDARLDDYRNISDARLLNERRIFIAEGRLVVIRLLASPRFRTRSLMVTRTAHDALAGSLGSHPDVHIYEVAQEMMNQVTGLNIHRGCLAVGERGADIEPSHLTASARRIVALERVGNPDNVGSIFRNAMAFNADGVLMDASSADPLYRKALRTSMGASLHLPFSRAGNWIEVLRDCRRSGMRLVALTPDSGAPPVAEVAASLIGERLMLIVGHEGDGISETTLSACELRARIPTRPGVDSLNVAAAAAIALYEVDDSQPLPSSHA